MKNDTKSFQNVNVSWSKKSEDRSPEISTCIRIYEMSLVSAKLLIQTEAWA